MSYFLFVDDRPCSETRPCSFNDALFNRTDINLILLRTKQDSLNQSYEERTKHLLSYCIDLNNSINDEVKKFKNWCYSKRLDIKYFCCMSEPRQELWQQFARLMNLPSISKKASRILRHKPTMKRFLNDIGLKTAKYQVIDSLNDITNFSSRNGFPVVMKPTDGWGTLDTYIIEDFNNIRLINNEIFKKEFMVETFVNYKEFECCSLIANTKVLDCFISVMPKSPLEASYGALNANISVPNSKEMYPVTKIKSQIKKIIGSLDIEFGYLHMEFFASKGWEDILISEFALRYPGCEIARNHAIANGFDIDNVTIDIYSGLTPKIEYRRSKCVGDLLLPYKAGKVQDISSERELLELPGVIKAKIGVKRNQVLPILNRSSFNCSGWVHVEGDNPEEVEKLMENVLLKYQISTTQDA